MTAPIGYDECEQAVQGLLQALTTIFPSTSQVVLGDFGVIDTGLTRAAVLVPAQIGRGRPSTGNYERTWGMKIWMFQAFDDYATTMTNFKTMRKAILDKLDNNRNLGGITGVNDTQVETDGDVTGIPKKGYPEGSPVFLAQVFRVTVYQTLMAGTP